MDKILSAPIAIIAILSLAIGGITPMLLGYPIWSYVLWSIGFVWLLGFLIYSKQRVWFNVYRWHATINNQGDGIILKIEGFIHSRHPDGIRFMKLFLTPKFGLDPSNIIELPDSINSKPSRFVVEFEITYQYAELALGKKPDGRIELPWLLSMDMLKTRWLYEGHPVHIRLFIDGQINGGESMTDYKRDKKALRNKGREGVSKQQFHNILDKASQPIKKSEKGKS